MALNPNNLRGETVRDPHGNQARFERWKLTKEISVTALEGVTQLSDRNRAVILRYVEDLELGVNGAPSLKKGPRSYTHLNTTRVRIARLASLLQKHANKDLEEVSARDVIALFHGMGNGSIQRLRGGRYRCPADYVKVFKGFWHWLMRVRRKEGLTLEDVTVDLNATPDVKPPFVYFTFEELKTLCANANRRMRVLMWFMYDSGIRSPTELANVKGKDVVRTPKGGVELTIREETTKTFGRRIKLLLSGDLVTEWIRDEKIAPDAFVFSFHPTVVNRYLKRLGARCFPDPGGKGRLTLGRGHFGELTMYDFRHSSGCYWLPRYKSENALKYRFGWKNSEMIYYYSELLGMNDTIVEDDLLDPEAKTQMERELERERRERAMLQEQLQSLQHGTSHALEERTRADHLMRTLLEDKSVQEFLLAKLKERAQSSTPTVGVPREEILVS